MKFTCMKDALSSLKSICEADERIRDLERQYVGEKTKDILERLVNASWKTGVIPIKYFKDIVDFGLDDEADRVLSHAKTVKFLENVADGLNKAIGMKLEILDIMTHLGHKNAWTEFELVRGDPSSTTADTLLVPNSRMHHANKTGLAYENPNGGLVVHVWTILTGEESEAELGRIVGILHKAFKSQKIDVETSAIRDYLNNGIATSLGGRHSLVVGTISDYDVLSKMIS